MENLDPDEVILLNIPIEGNLVSVCDGECELNCPSQEISSDFSDDGALLKNLWKEFDLECVFPYLQRSNVTLRSLQYMKAEDVKEAIPPLGLRMEFRKKLFVWKKKQFGIDEDTLSMPSKVAQWLQKCPDVTSTPSSSVNVEVNKKVFDKDLASLLNESLSSKNIPEFYASHKDLDNNYRDELIQIIVHQILKKDIALYSHDFQNILTEICTLFPTKDEVKVFLG